MRKLALRSCFVRERQVPPTFTVGVDLGCVIESTCLIGALSSRGCHAFLARYSKFWCRHACWCGRWS